ncbi:MAG: hypothetical protein AAFP17_15420 [Pseudomonadota bacterium]
MRSLFIALRHTGLLPLPLPPALRPPDRGQAAAEDHLDRVLQFRIGPDDPARRAWDPVVATCKRP